MADWLPGTWAPKGPPVVNLFTRPSCETGAGTVEVRRNLALYASMKGALSGWSTAGGPVLTPTSNGIQIDTAAAIAQNSNIIYSAANVATEPGVWRSSAFEVEVPAGFPAVTLYNYLHEYGSGIGLTPISGVNITISPGETKTVVAIPTAVAPAGATGVRTLLRSGAAAGFPAGGRIIVRNAVLEATPKPGSFFDGGFQAVPDPDLTESWVGSPGSSPSILSGVLVEGLLGNNCVAIRSSRWAEEGSYSVRLIATTASNNSYVDLGSTAGSVAPASSTVTVIATRHLDAALSGPLLRAGCVSVYNGAFQVSPALPNMAGDGEARVIGVTGATTPTKRVILHHGGARGSGDVWWDLVAVVAGAYDGPAFTGDTTSTDYEIHKWAGQPNASTSTRQEMEAVMATIWGTLSDFGLASLAPYSPMLRFTPSSPGVNGQRLFSARPIEARVATNGTFSVLLEPTYGVTPDVWYTVSIEYLNPGGQYTSYDVLGYRLRVPAPGGAIGELPDIPLGPDTVLVSLAPPPPGYVGWYLNAPGPGQPPGDPDDPASSGTGILEIVS